MSANMRRIMSETPRPFEVISRDAQGSTTPGRRKLSRATVAKRVEPLLALVASGDIPMDDHLAQAVASYVEAHHAKQQRPA